MKGKITGIGISGLVICLSLVMFTPGPATSAQGESECITCHRDFTPGIVDQWLTSVMSQNGLDCQTCHGSQHVTETDVDLALIPTPDTCNACHQDKVGQFRQGKHDLAWVAMQAIPAWTHLSARVGGPEGFLGCSGCHKIGEKPEDQLQEFAYGTASCDSCHTRHAFSKAEALDPRACQTCHEGFDHAQWEMWSTSKHGSIWQIENEQGLNVGRAPTCQTCHYQDGDHGVITAWGFLGLRGYEEDEEWWNDRVTIFKALGILDAQGQPTDRYQIIDTARVARFEQEEFQALRTKMEAICSECHGEGFVTQQLSADDQIIKEADAMMAQAIVTVQALYEDGILEASDVSDYEPDLLQFFEAPSDIEQELFRMFLEYRNRTFQGAFHANPDYMFWYGYAELQDSLRTIQDDAVALRAQAEPPAISPVVWVALGIGAFGMLVGIAAYTRRSRRG